ncbi:hypothetical protein ACFLR5_00405 [Elusimicrobiota bacterium]
MTGGLPGEYLSYFTVSAREQALGNASTASGKGAASAYFNPANIAGKGYHNIHALYTPVLGNGIYTSLFYSGAISMRNSVGVGVLSLQSGRAVKRNSWGEQTGSFYNYKRVIDITGTHLVSEKLYSGMSLKVIDEAMAGYSSTGIGIDAGMKFLPSERMKFAVVMQNILPPVIKMKNRADRFPMNLRLGSSLSFMRKKLNTSFDFWIFGVGEQTIFRWGMGAEYCIYRIIYLRTGLNYKELNAGLGLDLSRFTFSYAFRYSDVGLYHLVSTSYKFGFIPSEREKNLIEREKVIKEKEKDFENWKKNEEKKYTKKLTESYDILQDELVDTSRKRKELDALLFIAIEMKKGNYLKSEEMLKKILNKDTNHIDANKMLGILQEELGRDFSFNRMMSAYSEGNYEFAYNESKRADPGHVQYSKAILIGLLSSARIKINQKKYEEASWDLKEVIRLQKDNQVAWDLLKKIKILMKINTGENYEKTTD